MYKQHRLSSKTIFFLGFFLGVGLLSLLGFTNLPQAGDAAPADLRSAYREIYLDLVARAYETDSDLDLQMVLGSGWTSELSQTTLQALVDKTASSDQVTITRLRNLAQALNISVKFSENAYAQTPEATPTSTVGSISTWIFRIAGIIVLLLSIAVTVLFYLSKINDMGHTPQYVKSVNSKRTYKTMLEPTRWSGVDTLPMFQFLTTYRQGDKTYDLSVAIETSDNKFLGECGVGITPTLPKKQSDLVPAFEVWLSDKSDTQTATHVFLSDFVKTDEILRNKITRENPYSVPQADEVITLHTQSLTLRAKVLNTTYVIEGPHLNAYFEKFTLEVGIWAS